MLKRGQGYIPEDKDHIKPIWILPDYDLRYHKPYEEVFLQLPENLFPEVKPYYAISNYGRIWHKFLQDFLTINIDSKDYSYKPLSLKEGGQKQYRVHRLVLMTFAYFPGCENLIVNHKDLNKLNNMITNLEWTTYSGNLQHAYDNGAIDRSKKYKFKYGNDELIIKICEDLQNGDLSTDIANRYNIPIHIVDAIKNRRSHVNISKDYEFNTDRTEIASKAKSQIPIDTVHQICQYFCDHEYPDINQGNTFDIHNYNIELLNELGLEINETNIRRLQLIRYRKTFKSVSKDYKWD